jgi:FkbM family methyltransferase
MSIKKFFKISEKYDQINTVIHIGAHKGEEIPFYDSLNLDKVYLVEPIHEFHSILKSKTNSLSNFELLPIALGRKNSFQKFYQAKNEDSGSSSLLQPRPSDIDFHDSKNVEVKKFSTLNLDTIDMAVIDTQGYEIEVIEGFEEKVLDFKFLIIEFANYEGYLNQPTYRELNKIMNKKNFYMVYQIKRINKIIPNSNGGSYGDALYINTKYLSFFKTLFFKVKFNLLNNFLYDSFIFIYKNFKKKIKLIALDK